MKKIKHDTSDLKQRLAVLRTTVKKLSGAELADVRGGNCSNYTRGVE